MTFKMGAVNQVNSEQASSVGSGTEAVKRPRCSAVQLIDWRSHTESWQHFLKGMPVDQPILAPHQLILLYIVFISLYSEFSYEEQQT